jgi:hypothetical protein
MSSTAFQDNESIFRRNHGIVSFDNYNTVGQYTEQKEELLEALDYIEKINPLYLDEGQIKPNHSTVSMVRFFIQKLARHKEAADEIILSGDGEIILKWKKSDLKILVTFDSKLMHYSIKKSGETPIYKSNVLFMDPKTAKIDTNLVKNIPNRF